jgi:hypothetical protein
MSKDTFLRAIQKDLLIIRLACELDAEEVLVLEEVPPSEEGVALRAQGSKRCLQVSF